MVSNLHDAPIKKKWRGTERHNFTLAWQSFSGMKELTEGLLCQSIFHLDRSTCYRPEKL